MLSQEAFNVSFKMLKTCFSINPSNDDKQIFYRLLRDCDDNDVIAAATALCINNAKLYPGDNIVAIIREKITEIKKQAIIAHNRKIAEMERLEHKKQIARHMNRSEEETQKMLANIEEMKRKMGLTFTSPLLDSRK